MPPATAHHTAPGPAPHPQHDAGPARARRRRPADRRLAAAGVQPALNPLRQAQEAQGLAMIDVPARCRPTIPDPDIYALVVAGDCMAPLVLHGAMVICSPRTPLSAGALVAVWFHDLSPILKRLVALPVLPFVPGGEVFELLQFEMLNPPKRLWRWSEKIAAMHAVCGVMAPGEFEALSPLARGRIPAQPLALRSPGGAA